jgi:hypothetical protein
MLKVRLSRLPLQSDLYRVAAVYSVLKVLKVGIEREPNLHLRESCGRRRPSVLDAAGVTIDAGGLLGLVSA